MPRGGFNPKKKTWGRFFRNLNLERTFRLTYSPKWLEFKLSTAKLRDRGVTEAFSPHNFSTSFEPHQAKIGKDIRWVMNDLWARQFQLQYFMQPTYSRPLPQRRMMTAL